MSVFTVTAIIDGDTFEVTPRWKWNEDTGTRVRPTGYDATELYAYGGLDIDRLYEAPFTTISANGIDGVFSDELIDELLDLIARFNLPEI